MAKAVSSNGATLLTYLNPKKQKLMKYTEDGSIFYKTPSSGGWKLYGKFKAGVDVAAKVAAVKANAPAWAFKTSIPSVKQLKAWNDDCVCETPSGETVEPDGTGSDGAPSWLMIFGYI